MNGVGPPVERMDEDIQEAMRLLHEAARCIDRVHRSLFIDQDEYMMALADKAQRHIRSARKTSEKMMAIRNLTSDRSRQPAHEMLSPNGS